MNDKRISDRQSNVTEDRRSGANSKRLREGVRRFNRAIRQRDRLALREICALINGDATANAVWKSFDGC